MAGIAETCTHVAAMLFKLEAVIRCRETVTVTGQPAYWMIPSNVSKVGAEAGHRIDFTTPNSKRKSLNKILDGEGTSMPSPRASSSTCPHGIATEDQWTSYLAGIHTITPKAAVLCTYPDYYEAFVDPVQPFFAPKSLCQLRDEKFQNTELSALLLHCKTLADKAAVTPEQAHYIEKNTRKQQNSSAWHHFRAVAAACTHNHKSSLPSEQQQQSRPLRCHNMGTSK
ncbi:uncharacterized protein LOC119781440 [Cyprinodon tularosa]|uniref:uncharacterized protein LOC119781440 n=1 Tax=Cyprinodon tularosa TaxID=77115 RepID=UPI0018E207C7|nr:uncharacterized protein LOC119781440 [Cyprinodon tularosa]